jgi:hypothetical protein
MPARFQTSREALLYRQELIKSHVPPDQWIVELDPVDYSDQVDRFYQLTKPDADLYGEPIEHLMIEWQRAKLRTKTQGQFKMFGIEFRSVWRPREGAA